MLDLLLLLVGLSFPVSLVVLAALDRPRRHHPLDAVAIHPGPAWPDSGAAPNPPAVAEPADKPPAGGLVAGLLMSFFLWMVGWAIVSLAWHLLSAS